MAVENWHGPAYVLRCCGCEILHDEAGDGIVMLFAEPGIAQRWAEDAGWVCQGERHLCPECAQRREDQEHHEQEIVAAVCWALGEGDVR